MAVNNTDEYVKEHVDFSITPSFFLDCIPISPYVNTEQ